VLRIRNRKVVICDGLAGIEVVGVMGREGEGLVCGLVCGLDYKVRENGLLMCSDRW
jgi:hypothetical protein